MERGFFITGTDTGIGKTWATVALMRRLQRQGYRVAGMKPVAAGCQYRDGDWENDDALLLQRNASIRLAYRQVNPYAFELPVSPHLAAEGAEIDGDLLNNIFTGIKQQADVVLVEGAGGWLSPLSRELDNAGLALRLALPVIMVVGLRLGCLNHALLTWSAIERSGIRCAGWVAQDITGKMSLVKENIQYLQQHVDTPLLGVLPYCETADFEQLSYNFYGI